MDKNTEKAKKFVEDFKKYEKEFEQFQKEIESHEQKFRGSILGKTAVIDYSLARILAHRYIKDKNDHFDFLTTITPIIDFRRKIELFKGMFYYDKYKIIEKRFPKLICNLEELKDLRNKMAHNIPHHFSKIIATKEKSKVITIESWKSGKNTFERITENEQKEINEKISIIIFTLNIILFELDNNKFPKKGNP